MKSILPTLARLAPLLALFSCAPKAVVVQEGPAAKKEQVAEAPTVPEPSVPTGPDDGLRELPGMLELPGDGDFRATNPTAPKTSPDAGAVTVRPPTDPPPRPKKPKEGE